MKPVPGGVHSFVGELQRQGMRRSYCLLPHATAVRALQPFQQSGRLDPRRRRDDRLDRMIGGEARL